ncbi:MAG: hypothetical protein LBH98_04840 [Chitinispirillales bacterium]|jgi:hypothetical protein|nr:hypothetical protein [Chitinispirillales bacterium]
MKLFRFIFAVSVVFLSLSSAEIIDRKNLLDTSFVRRWNSILSDVEKNYSVIIDFLILDEEFNVVRKIPTITIIYKNSLQCFEIYQSNFSDESNFVIPSLFFSEVIPEANELFKSGKTEQAAEYILMNVKETLQYYKAYLDETFIETESAAADVKVDGLTEKTKNYWKNILLVGLLISLVVFLYLIFAKNKRSANLNRSYFFTGMSGIDFF